MNMSSDAPLDSPVLLRFRASLQQQEHELRQVIDKAEKEVRVLTDAGPLGAMDLSCDNSFKESMFAHISQIRRQLRLVQYALARIRNGEFGTCAGCEDTIGLKRLQAVPWARHCFDCQERFEQVQRRAAMVELYCGNTIQR
jgi:DnaK suppressor protein